ncbi:hypothetical protein QAD02_023867 [Eretmocerus hayati]|uniref:Uncharacterized protein n=1 Tax=Eretmocerus hayati TaxID=131215 RepID=A0ACC2PX75_9HYME|nr:hypothetical protein QAD02_023867 [Eretmocerus hayati]
MTSGKIDRCTPQELQDKNHPHSKIKKLNEPLQKNRVCYWYSTDVIRQDRAYKKKNCTFEPGLYQKHTPAGEEFSIGDVKTMIKYSITFNPIEECEYKQTYGDSVFRGELQHGNHPHSEIRTLNEPLQENRVCYWYSTDVIRQDKVYEEKNCTFEPGFYQKHTPAGEGFPIGDGKFVIKYSITFNLKRECEDKQTYGDFVTRGYLTHRRPRTLRRHFRTQILCNINEYGLPSGIVEEFRNLQS